MSNPQTNTKIERVVEAFEELAVAVAVSVKGNEEPRKAFDAVAFARVETATALREFLQPTLRVIGQ